MAARNGPSSSGGPRLSRSRREAAGDRLLAPGLSSVSARTLELIARMGGVAVLPTDEEDVRLRKATLAFSVGMISLAGVVWALIYAALGLRRAAIIPFGYSALSVVNLVLLRITKRYEAFRFAQLLLVLSLPFLLQLTLGGFVASGAVMLWALLAPVGALLFHGTREAVWWFLAYLALALLSSAIEGQPGAGAVAPAPAAAVFFAMNVGAVSAVMFLLLRYFVRENEVAQARSERLLLNVLPKPIAIRLKKRPAVIADGFDDASVLFADLVDFTTFSAGISPQELVECLNEVFSIFDRLCEQHGLEKIKTIGDAYMVAAGVPAPRPDHAEAVAEMALDMLQALAEYRAETGAPLSLRIGISSGPVVAGVIGQNRFIYDVWGDTVNTASRMESHGLPGTIQVPEATRHRLRHGFSFEERGLIDVKGKGPMATYFLVGRSNSPTEGA